MFPAPAMERETNRNSSPFIVRALMRPERPRPLNISTYLLKVEGGDDLPNPRALEALRSGNQLILLIRLLRSRAAS